MTDTFSQVNNFRRVYSAGTVPTGTTVGNTWFDVSAVEEIVFLTNIGTAFNDVIVDVLVNSTQSATGATVVTDTISTYTATTSSNRIGIIELRTAVIPTAQNTVNNIFVNLRIRPTAGTIPFFSAQAILTGLKYPPSSNTVGTANGIAFVGTAVVGS